MIGIALELYIINISLLMPVHLPSHRGNSVLINGVGLVVISLVNVLVVLVVGLVLHLVSEIRILIIPVILMP